MAVFKISFCKTTKGQMHIHEHERQKEGEAKGYKVLKGNALENTQLEILGVQVSLLKSKNFSFHIYIMHLTHSG